MEIEQAYPNLANFLMAYIAESDLEGFSNDHEVAQNYAATESSLACSNLVKDGRAILTETQFPWQEVCAIGNRYFEDPEIVKQWLQELIEIIEAETKK